MGTTRGDLKILNRTLRELRYAFKVFQPYRRRRKVTVFGSARTSPAQPAYQQAVEFSRAMAGMGGLSSRRGWRHHGSRKLGRGSRNVDGPDYFVALRAAGNDVIHGDPKLVTMKYFFTRN